MLNGPITSANDIFDDFDKNGPIMHGYLCRVANDDKSVAFSLSIKEAEWAKIPVESIVFIEVMGRFLSGGFEYYSTKIQIKLSKSPDAKLYSKLVSLSLGQNFKADASSNFASIIHFDEGGMGPVGGPSKACFDYEKNQIIPCP